MIYNIRFICKKKIQEVEARIEVEAMGIEETTDLVEAPGIEEEEEGTIIEGIVVVNPTQATLIIKEVDISITTLKILKESTIRSITAWIPTLYRSEARLVDVVNTLHLKNTIEAATGILLQ